MKVLRLRQPLLDCPRLTCYLVGNQLTRKSVPIFMFPFVTTVKKFHVSSLDLNFEDDQMTMLLVSCGAYLGIIRLEPLFLILIHLVFLSAFSTSI